MASFPSCPPPSPRVCLEGTASDSRQLQRGISRPVLLLRFLRVFLTWHRPPSSLNTRRPITVSVGQKSRHDLAGSSACGLPGLHSRCHPGCALICGSAGKGATSWPIAGAGRILFFVIVGPRALLPCWLSSRATLSPCTLCPWTVAHCAPRVTAVLACLLSGERAGRGVKCRQHLKIRGCSGRALSTGGSKAGHAQRSGPTPAAAAHRHPWLSRLSGPSGGLVPTPPASRFRRGRPTSWAPRAAQ